VVDQIRAVSNDRLAELIGTISAEEVVTIEEDLRAVLDLN
jgi:mRNA-degrading endonuclease toxin of MazEF toxin-antitoxin module